MAITTPNIDFEFIGRVDAAQDYAFCPEMYCGNDKTAAAYTRGFLKLRPKHPYALAWAKKHSDLFTDPYNKDGADYTPPSVQ